MQSWLTAPPLGSNVQGARHLIELFVAFGLTTLIGLERTIQGKSAGLRTQTIVGTSSVLIMLVSKYGFTDVLSAGTNVLDRHALRPKWFRGSASWVRASSSPAAGRCTG